MQIEEARFRFRGTKNLGIKNSCKQDQNLLIMCMCTVQTVSGQMRLEHLRLTRTLDSCALDILFSPGYLRLRKFAP